MGTTIVVRRGRWRWGRRATRERATHCRRRRVCFCLLVMHFMALGWLPVCGSQARDACRLGDCVVLNSWRAILHYHHRHVPTGTSDWSEGRNMAHRTSIPRHWRRGLLRQAGAPWAANASAVIKILQSISVTSSLARQGRQEEQAEVRPCRHEGSDLIRAVLAASSVDKVCDRVKISTCLEYRDTASVADGR